MVDWPSVIQAIPRIAKGNPSQFQGICLRCTLASATSSFCEHAECGSEDVIEWQDLKGMLLCSTGLMFKEGRKWLLVRL